MIEKLSSKQQIILEQVKLFWSNYLFSNKGRIDDIKAKDSIEWLYNNIIDQGFRYRDNHYQKEKPPVILYAFSPLGCQMAAYILQNVEFGSELTEETIKKLADDLNADAMTNDCINYVISESLNAILKADSGTDIDYLFHKDTVVKNKTLYYESKFLNRINNFGCDLVEISDSILHSVATKFEINLKISRGGKYTLNDPITIEFGTQNGAIGNIVRKIIEDIMESNNLNYTEFSNTSNSVNYGRSSFFDFFNKIGVPCNEDFNGYRNLFLSGIYEMILLEDFCIVCGTPTKLLVNDSGILHSDKGAAISWADGFELYFWNGINIPKEWIRNKDKINRKTVLSERNVEKRRCIREIIGKDRFIEIMDLVCIDEDVEKFGKPIKLFKTNEKDEQINNYLYFLSVVCPSTNREYFISVKPTNSVWRAKAQTFQNKKINFRQGDVGLVRKDKQSDEIIIET